jgi:dTDP-L-rhamnose 4-epimerase
MRVLVTGGAGFVGSHTVDALVEAGHRVRVFDSLDPQVHGPSRMPPAWLNPAAELRVGDVRDSAALAEALDGIDAVLHLAAAVGVGQSMYEIRHYVEVNALGAANLLELLAKTSHAVRRLVVASSMSIYGEGAYRCERCGALDPILRPEEQLARRDWEIACPGCGAHARPIPTPETKRLYPASIYAVTKRDHEEMFVAFGAAYGIPVVALRYFNIYGPRQALSNPYTGVAAIFASRMLNGNPPLVYEDGHQSRDFVHVRDIARANVIALTSSRPGQHVFNVGTGRRTSVLEMATLLGRELGFRGEATIVGRFRAGDVRHCYGDVRAIRDGLGFEAGVPLEDGVRELAAWLARQSAVDRVEAATEELAKRGLLK